MWLQTGSKDELPSKYHWEQKTLEDNVFKSGKVTHAAIVSLKDGELRAATPRDFRPHPKGKAQGSYTQGLQASPQR